MAETREWSVALWLIWFVLLLSLVVVVAVIKAAPRVFTDENGSQYLTKVGGSVHRLGPDGYQICEEPEQ